MIENFSKKIIKIINYNFIIYSLILITTIFLVTYGIIKQNVQNNLNILFRNKENIINNVFLTMSDEFRNYVTEKPNSIQTLDFIYNTKTDKYLYKNFLEKEEKISNINYSQSTIKLDKKDYLISYQYFQGDKYIYGININHFINILNNENEFGKYYVILRIKNDIYYPSGIIFKKNIDNILSENIKSIRLNYERYEIKSSSNNFISYYVLINSNILDQFKDFIIFIAIFFIILSFIIIKMISAYLDNQIKTPINTIVEGIKSIRMKNEKSINYDGNDEFKMISKEFNSLYKSLDTTINELKISETNAKKSSEFKSNILKILSHEIRTPLQSIIGYSSQLKINTSEENKMMLEMIKNSSYDLLNKFERLHERAKIESESENDGPKLNIEKIDMINFIMTVSSKFESLCEKKSLKFILKVMNDPEEILIDKYKIKRILEEILDNAIKFTDDGQIEVIIDKNKQDTIITIKDDGPGINIEDMDILFEDFFQTDNYLKRRRDGLGIGLSISKHYIKMHGGSIKVKTPEKGTEFIIIIPSKINKEKIENFNFKKDIEKSFSKYEILHSEKATKKDYKKIINALERKISILNNEEIENESIILYEIENLSKEIELNGLNSLINELIKNNYANKKELYETLYNNIRFQNYL
ncbi:HAMP domain-containing histidine kinase [Oceanotoga sp. DSM 15011]|uniref:sensor histidine kinase n=1 Tax=Oceanotoga sp. DSM 15011 TaxID=2984951 RepID=UPI0021F3F7D2|nr:HAMP domain-containing sensor histidine kinase [Oceanotoga sp. DSM 15011]UYO99521.1 HAMP domain-containing histidine kinase [Oceanotoga sp. DSM 15011]